MDTLYHSSGDDTRLAEQVRYIPEIPLHLVDSKRLTPLTIFNQNSTIKYMTRLAVKNMTQFNNQNYLTLSPSHCDYLLNLIEEMDSDTPYTERQRSFTIPKLLSLKSQLDPTTRLFFQDVDYLLELIEDDDLTDQDRPGIEALRNNTYNVLMEIKRLQIEKFEEYKSIDRQRALRAQKRRGQ